MTAERTVKLGFTHTVAIQQDLITGEKSLVTKRRKSPIGARNAYERAQILESWWTQSGWGAFSLATQGWKNYQGARLAELTGQSVEYASAALVDAEAEQKLRDAFSQTRFRPITTLEIINRIKKEAMLIKYRDSTATQWLGSFLNYVVDIVSEVHSLGENKKAELKAYLSQDQFLPGFN